MNIKTYLKPFIILLTVLASIVAIALTVLVVVEVIEEIKDSRRNGDDYEYEVKVINNKLKYNEDMRM